MTCEALASCHLHTDSKVAIKAWGLARQSSPVAFAFHPEFDSVLRLRHALRPEHTLSKIKAHEDLTAIHDLDLLYQRLGNKAANDIAIYTNKHAIPSFATDLEDTALQCQETKTAYGEVLQYFIELNKARTVACSHQHAARGHMQVAMEHQRPVIALQEWSPTEFWQAPFHDPGDCAHLEACSWTAEVAIATVKFFLSCRWPTTTSGPGYSPIGLSWIEISLGIMLFLQKYLPVRRYLADGQCHLVHGPAHHDLQMMGVSLGEFGKSTSHLVAQVTKLWPLATDPGCPEICGQESIHTW